MSADFPDRTPEFRCPVCRARQTLRAECRRCAADLSLVVRAHRRVHSLLAQQQHAHENEDHQRALNLAKELRQLAPNW